MTGKTSPDQGRSPADLFSGGYLKEKDEEVDESVGEKEIEQVTKSVGRSFCDYFPKIFAAGAADAFLGHEDSRKKHDKDTYVKEDK